MSTLRFSVVEKAFQAKPVEVPVPAERPSEYFGKYVFNREKMFKPWTTERRWTATWPTKWLRA